jgi:hypothetical protein
MPRIRFLDDHGGTPSPALKMLREQLARIASTDPSGASWLCVDEHDEIAGEDVFDVRIWPLADWREELCRRAPAERIVAEFAECIERRARTVRALEKSDEPCPLCGSPLEVVQTRIPNGSPVRYVRCTRMTCAYGAHVPADGPPARDDD